MPTAMNGNEPGALRLFYALWPDDSARIELMNLQATLQGRLTRYENFHLTLAFLGDQPVAVLPYLQKVLKQLPLPDINLELDRIGYFSKQRIAWAGMHQIPDPLNALHQELIHKLALLDITPASASRFKPHVTLARDTAAPPDLLFTPIRWRAGHLALVLSTMLQDGVHYRVLASR